MTIWKDSFSKASFEYARSTTAHYSKSFYFSARLLPKRRRWATYAVYAFCRYADNLIDKPRQRTTQDLLKELESVRTELQTAYKTGESEHPILHAFVLVAKEYGIPIKYPLELLEGVRMDLQKRRYQSFSDLYLFCYRVAGVVGLMMTHVLGYRDASAFRHAEKLGIAMQLTNILRDVKEDMSIGRLYLPEDELRRFGVTSDDFSGEIMTGNLQSLMEFQTERAHRYYEEAEAGIPMLLPKSQYAIYSASRTYRGILTKLEEREYNPFKGRVYVPFRTKVAILLTQVIKTRLSAFWKGLIGINDIYNEKQIASERRLS